MALVFRHSSSRHNISRPEAVIGEWTTSKLAQSTTVIATAGAVYRCYWGDGIIDTYIGNGGVQVCAHNYAVAGTYTQRWVIDYAKKLLYFINNSNLLVGSIVPLSNYSSLLFFRCYNNQLTGAIPSLGQNPVLVDLSCYSNLLTGSIPSLSSNPLLTTFRGYSNQLTGSIPSLLSNPALVTFYCSTNQLTGSIPSLSGNPALAYFECTTNQLTGSIPSLSSNAALVTFACSDNQLTGSIPSLSSNLALKVFMCNSNQLSGYTASVLAATITTFYVSTNLLPLPALTQILTDFQTNLAARPAVVILSLGGVGNAALDAAALAIKVAILAAKPGWIITHN